jgi:hypothetical protein
MKTAFLHTLVMAAILAVSALLALVSVSLLAEQGAFGSCFEGSCGYAALFVGFPLVWLALAVAGIGLWVRWWCRRKTPALRPASGAAPQKPKPPLSPERPATEDRRQ